MSSSLAGRANSFKQLQHHLTRFAILSVTKAWLILSRLPDGGMGIDHGWRRDAAHSRKTRKPGSTVAGTGFVAEPADQGMSDSRSILPTVQ